MCDLCSLEQAGAKVVSGCSWTRPQSRRSAILYFTCCPKCKTGTLERESDNWGYYLACLMCGYLLDFEGGQEPAAVLARVAAAAAEKNG